MCQTKFGDAINLWHPLKDNKNEITLINMKTTHSMKRAKRFPVPEKLLHMWPKFDLHIDSLMHAAYNSDNEREEGNRQPSIGAPCNSEESLEQIDLEKDEDFEDNTGVEIVRKTKEQVDMYPDTKEGRLYTMRMKSLKIHREALSLSGFDVGVLKLYPSNLGKIDIPLFVLNQSEEQMDARRVQHEFNKGKKSEQFSAKSILGIFEVRQFILEEFNEKRLHKRLFPSDDHRQIAFEHYCSELNCNPFTIMSYVKNSKLKMVNYTISENKAKAIACILPVIPELEEVYFENNNLSDTSMALIFMSCFISPTVSRLTIIGNFIQQLSASTLNLLLQTWPQKITQINFRDAMSNGIHITNCF